MPVNTEVKGTLARLLATENLTIEHRKVDTACFDAERDLIASQESRLGIELDTVQLEAIHAALQNKVLIITGGPGTGKTTLVRFILGLMSRMMKKLIMIKECL